VEWFVNEYEEPTNELACVTQKKRTIAGHAQQSKAAKKKR